jgi:hypothetical protein
LIWAEKSGYVKFQPEAIALIQEQASFAAWQTHQAEEVKPWFEDQDLEARERELLRSIQNDDVPF